MPLGATRRGGHEVLQLAKSQSWVRAEILPQPPLKLVGRAVRANEVEVAANPRARSATMRVAERTKAALT